MRRLILHVGPSKTGTTAIQAALAREPEVLAAHGLGYVRLGRSNHGTPIWSLFADDPAAIPPNRKEGRLTRAAVDAFNARTRAALERELGRPRAPTMILSGEGMAVMAEPEAARMLAFLRRFTDDVEVIAFVRPPLALLTSRFQQQVKSGVRCDELGKVRVFYRNGLAKYRRLLPPGALDLRLYHRPALPGGCVVRAFLAACGVPAPALEGLAVVRANESLSQAAVAWLLAVNELFPNRPDGLPHPWRPRGLLRLAGRIGGPRFRLPGELADAFLARDAEDIAWMSGLLGTDLRALDAPVDRAAPTASLTALARRTRSLRAMLGASAPAAG